MSATAVAALPLAVRAWAATRALGPFRGQARVGVGLVRRFVRSEVTYRGALGFPLRIDPDDYFQACMLLGLYDPTGLALARRFVLPGSVVVDAGAHLGYFALTFAHLVGPAGEVHAFECDPRAAARLREHVRLAMSTTVYVHEAAVFDGTTRELNLRLPEQLGWATVRPEHWVEGNSEVTVPAVGLDDHLSDAGVEARGVSFLKLDVEGAELSALRGAQHTLQTGSPTILIEFDRPRMAALGDDPDEILGLLGELGYEPFAPRVAMGGRLVLECGHASASSDLVFVRRQPAT